MTMMIDPLTSLVLEKQAEIAYVDECLSLNIASKILTALYKTNVLSKDQVAAVLRSIAEDTIEDAVRTGKDEAQYHARTRPAAWLEELAKGFENWDEQRGRPMAPKPDLKVVPSSEGEEKTL
jgi:hypothetical protein